MHEHRFQGQALRHSHADGGQPHHYFGHAEDPPMRYEIVGTDGTAHGQFTADTWGDALAELAARGFEVQTCAFHATEAVTIIIIVSPREDDHSQKRD